MKKIENSPFTEYFLEEEPELLTWEVPEIKTIKSFYKGFTLEKVLNSLETPHVLVFEGAKFHVAVKGLARIAINEALEEDNLNLSLRVCFRKYSTPQTQIALAIVSLSNRGRDMLKKRLEAKNIQKEAAKWA